MLFFAMMTQPRAPCCCKPGTACALRTSACWRHLEWWRWEVRRKPLVAVLSTGDEVVPSSATPPPGKIRDINAHSIAALCREAGAQPMRAGIVNDDAAKLKAAVTQLAETHDVVVVSGGSSAGMRDHTVENF